MSVIGPRSLPKQSLTGEWGPVCLSFWAYHSRLFPAEAEWFVRNAKVLPSELTVPSGSTLNPTISFQWKASQIAPRTERTPSLTDNIVQVRETASGRFHLTGFGVDHGGPNRDVPFSFQVIDTKGELIAESAKSTSTALGIAERGRLDYNRNKFHQTDFFLARDGRDPAPNSPIAKRASWVDLAELT